MLSTFADIQTDVVRKLGISTTNAYYTDAILNAWIQQAHRWATSYKKWPFTEGRVSTTYTGSEEYQFEGYKADTIRIITIGGQRYQKINWDDYLIMKETQPNASDRVFSDYGRLVVVNSGAGGSGTLTAYGQYTPADIDVTDHTAPTVFSYGDEEGNEAIVEKVMEFAKARQLKPDDAIVHLQKAAAILEALWNKCQDEQYAYQTARQRGGMFERFDVVDPGFDDTLNRNQFNI
jgi:hypothetical protein